MIWPNLIIEVSCNNTIVFNQVKSHILHALNTRIEFDTCEILCMILAEVISELNLVEFDACAPFNVSRRLQFSTITSMK